MGRFIIIFFSLNVFAQTQVLKTTDVRNVSWGMSIEEVKEVENSKQTILIDTVNYVDEINKVLIVPSLIINNTKTKLFYEFRNNQLIKLVYYFYNQDTSNLFSRVVNLNRIYNGLTSNKNMKILYCWSYGSESYKRLSNQKACDFKNKKDIDNIEKVAKEYEHIQEAIFSLNNKRSIASFIFNLKDDKSISKLQFIPSVEVKKQIINKSF